MEWLAGWIESYGLIVLFLAVALAVIGWPNGDDDILMWVGGAIADGHLHPAAAVMVLAGAVAGVTALYGVGRWGRVFLSGRQSQVADFREWFQERSAWILVIGLFFPWLRPVTALAAGLLSIEWPRFRMWGWGGTLFWAVVQMGLNALTAMAVKRMGADGLNTLFNWVVVAVSVVVVGGLAALFLFFAKGKRGEELGDAPSGKRARQEGDRK